MAGWRSEEEVFLVMWKSQRSGATLTEIRKSEAGKERFVIALEILGVPANEIMVIPQTKKWMPEAPKVEQKGKAGRRKAANAASLHIIKGGLSQNVASN